LHGRVVQFASLGGADEGGGQDQGGYEGLHENAPVNVSCYIEVALVLSSCR
jgi:hypothetical protein